MTKLNLKDSKAKGDAAAKATNTPSKPPAGSFGISAAGKKQAEANKEKKKAKLRKKKVQPKKSSPSTSTRKQDVNQNRK